MSALLAFRRGDGPAGRGRRIAAIWAMSDAELEASHDFIQWLFPLDTPSAAVPGSPVLAAEEIAVLPGDRTIRANLRRLTRILRSLVRAGERDAAAALFVRLGALCRGAYRATIGAKTFAHWSAALGSSTPDGAPPAGWSQRG